ncbi:MAG: hypothetical protein V4797_01125 [Paraburkholderia tropica]|uniref:hypothetical protein n=1 Tax=Paraburkholderia tropica TaxID=92647 RepID=UPI0031016631
MKDAANPHPGERHVRHAPTRAQHAAAWFGLVGVPLIWMTHVLLCTGLVATACAGGVVQRNALPWPLVHWALAFASLFAVALALAGVLAARRAWRDSAAFVAPQRETFRFVAWCGSAVSIAFAIGLAFTISVLLLLPLQPLCESLR